MHNPQRTALAALLLAAALAAPAAEPDGLPFQPGQRVLFLGDSITHGGQYIAFVQTYLWATQPKLNLDVINLGLSSETVNGMSEPGHPFPRPCILSRADKALQSARPDWTLVCYGMNDGIYYPPRDDVQAAYRKGWATLRGKLTAAGSEVIPLTPPPFDAATKRARGGKLLPAARKQYGYRGTYEGYDKVLGLFAEHVRGLADANGVDRVIDLHAPMNAYIAAVREKHPDYRYGDGVHPPADGHLKMALIILDALGENAAAAEKLLTRLTGVALKTREADKPTKAQREFLSAVMKRHRELSAAWREHVGHTLPHHAKTPPLAEALKIAAAREATIRALIAERMAEVSVSE